MRLLAISALLALGLTAVPAHAVGDVRSLELRDVRLRKGDVIGISFHPSERPIEVDASTSRLEVCPVGWPSSEFDSCEPVDEDGHLTLPSTRINTFHLGITIQGDDRTRVEIERLAVQYEAIDSYFLVHLPEVAPGRRSPTLLVTPATRDTIGIEPFEPGFERPAEAVSVVVRQGDRRVRRDHDAEPVGHARAVYGPVRLDRSVRIRAKNGGANPVEIDLLVDWG
jgi:hypothetical protein